MSDNSTDEERTISDTLSNPLMLGNIVFGIGILFLLAGVGYFVGGVYLEEIQPDVRQIPKTTSKRETKPYAQYNKKEKPWLGYVKPESSPAAEPFVSAKPNVEKQSKTTASKQRLKSNKKLIQNSMLLYTCSVLSTFDRFIGKEIIYFVQQKNVNGLYIYEPIFKKKDWDGRGYTIKNQFIGFQIDKQNKMIEVQKNKWIPAQEFALCQPQEVYRR